MNIKQTKMETNNLKKEVVFFSLMLIEDSIGDLYSEQPDKLSVKELGVYAYAKRGSIEYIAENLHKNKNPLFVEFRKMELSRIRKLLFKQLCHSYSTYWRIRNELENRGLL